MKAKITVKTTETVTVDIGDMPIHMFRDILKSRGDGTFDGNWSVGDLPGVDFTVTSIDVEEASGR